ncbi:hypothetical protein DL96DRAFT_1822497 [Flagelloscypha sp. PMI_526]|nr:hypothetical protein DL96DRAFT_1822497 [Flagelloscypha sp. PMI_526]
MNHYYTPPSGYSYYPPTPGSATSVSTVPSSAGISTPPSYGGWGQSGAMHSTIALPAMTPSPQPPNSPDPTKLQGLPHPLLVMDPPYMYDLRVSSRQIGLQDSVRYAAFNTKGRSARFEFADTNRYPWSIGSVSRDPRDECLTVNTVFDAWKRSLRTVVTRDEVQALLGPHPARYEKVRAARAERCRLQPSLDPHEYWRVDFLEDKVLFSGISLDPRSGTWMIMNSRPSRR